MRLVKLADGSAGLLFLFPETRVVRLMGNTYQEARDKLAGQLPDLKESDTDGEQWARTVAKADGTIDVAGVL